MTLPLPLEVHNLKHGLTLHRLLAVNDSPLPVCQANPQVPACCVDTVLVAAGCPPQGRAARPCVQEHGLLPGHGAGGHLPSAGSASLEDSLGYVHTRRLGTTGTSLSLPTAVHEECRADSESLVLFPLNRPREVSWGSLQP